MSGFSANFSNLPPGYSVNDIEEWQEDPDLERKARYEDPFWNTAPLSEGEAYDLLQEEQLGITPDDLYLNEDEYDPFDKRDGYSEGPERRMK